MTAYRMDHGHYAWSPVVARPRLEWPHGARVAVAFVVSLGHYEADPPADAFDPPTHASPLRVIPYPDYPTVTHREYGYRVGIFRLFDLFDTYGMKATAAVDALTARRYAGLVAESRKRGWEVAAHGIGQRQALSGATTDSAERAYIRATLDALTIAGVSPTGWLGAEQSESARTPTLLAEAGLRYVGDWANDDQPYFIGPGDALVSLPVMRDLGDVDLHWRRRVAIPRWSALVREAFDTLYRDGQESGRVLTLPLHPWCIGQPFRVKYLEEVLAHVRAHDAVWLTTAAEIAAWYRTRPAITP
jgi:peptidoglycan/xylan/chitin deacetylase (PgdA/CDA1 family)